jgi:hypothetical protein
VIASVTRFGQTDYASAVSAPECGSGLVRQIQQLLGPVCSQEAWRRDEN